VDFHAEGRRNIIEEYASSADKLRGIKNKEDGGHNVSGVFFIHL
jgi:hypothetical protein